MMKKLVSLVLVFALLCGACALANDYSGSQENEASFETLAEARLSAPEAIAHLEMNEGNVYTSHPVLDDYPCDTTYVYRSANMYGGRAAARLNTNIVVYTEDSFETKDDAFAYLTGLGLIDIIDEAIGSVVLVTPGTPVGEDSSGNRTGGFGLADQQNYYRLQTAMFSQKAGGNADGSIDPPSDTDLWKSYEVYYADGEYFGGYGYYYLIGIGGGATFLNNYVAGTFDYISRVAGMLLIGGQMDRIRTVATFVPVYLVNAPEAVIEKYKAANDVDTYNIVHGVEIFNPHSQSNDMKTVLQMQREGDLLVTAGSDFHDVSEVGRTGLTVDRAIETAEDLRDYLFTRRHRIFVQPGLPEAEQIPPEFLA